MTRRALLSTAFLAAGLGLAACSEAAGDGSDSGGPPGRRVTSYPTTARRGPAAAPAGALRFEERALASGIDFKMEFLPEEQGENFKINLYDHGCGVVVADYDGDGHDDVLFLNQLGSNALYRNRGDGTFEETTSQAGPLALPDRVCVAGVFADYDEDGDQDLYITSTRGGNVLLRNRGDGTFEDVSKAAGVDHVGHSQSAAFFDYDADGRLDLFVTNTAVWTTDSYEESHRYFPGKPSLLGLIGSRPESNLMYRNVGDGTFEDVTRELGLGGTSWGGDVAVFDHDEDGDLDLFVTNMFGASKLYENTGGKFRDVRANALGRTSWGAIGARVLDADGDGHLDLALADMHSDMWMESSLPPRLFEPHRKYAGMFGRMLELDQRFVAREQEVAGQLGVDYSSVVFGSTLFLNRGSGRFEEVSERAGFETLWPWGVAPGDFDGDGHEDVYLPSGMGYPYVYWPSAMLRNRGDGTFEEVAESAGIEPPARGRYLHADIGGRAAPRSSRCAATGDFDGDGRLDLMVNNFNDHPYYFVNVTDGGHHLSLRLRGTESNGDAIGALVRLSVGERTLVRQVQTAGGYLSQSSRTLHFGLGDATRIDRCEIRWPSGTMTVLEDVAADELLEVVEGE